MNTSTSVQKKVAKRIIWVILAILCSPVIIIGIAEHATMQLVRREPVWKSLLFSMQIIGKIGEVIGLAPLSWIDRKDLWIAVAFYLGGNGIIASGIYTIAGAQIYLIISGIVCLLVGLAIIITGNDHIRGSIYFTEIPEQPSDTKDDTLS